MISRNRGTRAGLGRRTALTLGGFALAAFAVAGLLGEPALAQEKLKVAGIYTVPIQQKWVGTLHRDLNAAAERGEIDYSFSYRTSDVSGKRLSERVDIGGRRIITQTTTFNKKQKQ